MRTTISTRPACALAGRKIAAARVAEARDTAAVTRTPTLVLLAGIALAAVVATPLVRAISRGMRRLVEAARGIAQGDVEQGLDARSRDEIGDVAFPPRRSPPRPSRWPRPPRRRAARSARSPPRRATSRRAPSARSSPSTAPATRSRRVGRGRPLGPDGARDGRRGRRGAHDRRAHRRGRRRRRALVVRHRAGDGLHEQTSASTQEIAASAASLDRAEHVVGRFQLATRQVRRRTGRLSRPGRAAADVGCRSRGRRRRHRRRDRSLARLHAVSPRQADRLTPVQAARLAGIAARRHGISDPIGPLRTGDNHVFRAGDAVVRVAPRSADVSGQIALARWLISEGFRVAAALADAEVIDGAQLSLWEYVDADARRPIDFEQLGAIVARLHRVAPLRLNDVVPLPFWGDAAWLAVEQNLAPAEASNVVGREGLAVLRRECLALRGWQDRARRGTLVVCHGDVHPQNVVMSGDEVVILDWDTICLGPPAWDHAALITWAERWGGAAESYPDFARGYGADLRESPLADELAALRLLAPAINTIVSAAGDPMFAAEAEARMRYWQGDPTPPTWTPL